MKRTKLYFDTEFTGLHKNTTLISIGIVSECGKEFYAEFTDYDKDQIDSWLQKNVINNLHFTKGLQFTKIENYHSVRGDTDRIRAELEDWLKQFGDVEMYSDCYAYDWVLFCDIWGHAFNVPDNVYYIPQDLSTALKEAGIDPDISREDFIDMKDLNLKIKHNALYDARIIKKCYEKLDKLKTYAMKQLIQIITTDEDMGLYETDREDRDQIEKDIQRCFGFIDSEGVDGQDGVDELLEEVGIYRTYVNYYVDLNLKG